jgi:hypothetical protein
MKATTSTLGGLLLAFLSMAILANPASGVIVVYDLRLDFSNANNPNTPWEYLKGNVPLTHFTPVTNPILATAVANGYWGDTASSDNSAIMLTTADGSTTGLWNDNDFTDTQVLVRTTDPLSGGPMIITWTAPTNGTFTYSGEFWNANAPLGPGGNSFTLSLNNAPPLEIGSASTGQSRPTGYAMVNGLTPTNVIAGDVLALEMNPLPGPPFGSLSGVTFTIDFTPVPEPSALVLAAIGMFGLVVRAGRRRRQAAAANHVR